MQVFTLAVKCLQKMVENKEYDENVIQKIAGSITKLKTSVEKSIAGVEFSAQEIELSKIKELLLSKLNDLE